MPDFAKSRYSTCYPMTRDTQRDNIKPVLAGITGMMVMLRLFTAGALQVVGMGQFTAFNSTLYGSLGGIFNEVCFSVFFLSYLTSFAIAVSFACSFIFIAFLITFLPNFVFICLAMFFKTCFNTKWIFFIISPYSVPTCLFTIFCLRAFFKTLFTLIAVIIFASWTYRKIRDILYLFANKTSFCYDLLRHGFLQHRKLCLRAGRRLRPAVGSFHNTTNRGAVK